MKASLHDVMRVGIIHFMAYPKCMGGDGPIIETLAALAHDDFFEVIEVRRSDARRGRSLTKPVSNCVSAHSPSCWAGSSI